MVTITFRDRDTERKALALLLGRFSGRVLKGHEHLVPDAALDLLTEQKIPFAASYRDVGATQHQLDLLTEQKIPFAVAGNAGDERHAPVETRVQHYNGRRHEAEGRISSHDRPESRS